MASLQAHLAVWILKWRVKRKLRGVRDYRIARKILRPGPYKVPSNVRISPAQLNGIGGSGSKGHNRPAVCFSICMVEVTSGVPPRRIGRSRRPSRSEDSAFLRQTIALPLRILFPPRSTTLSGPTVAFSSKVIPRNGFL